jgi:hypothetical protein
MKHLILIAVAALLFACSAEKRTQKTIDRVIKNPVAFQAVGNEYILRYGCLSDTPDVKYLPGKTVFVYDTLRDTIRNKVPCDDFTSKTDKGTSVTVKDGNLTLNNDSMPNTIRVDTTIYTVIDKTQAKVLSDSLQYYRNAAKVDNERINGLSAENLAIKAANKAKSGVVWLVAALGLALSGLFAFLWFKK